MKSFVALLACKYVGQNKFCTKCGSDSDIIFTLLNTTEIIICFYHFIHFKSNPFIYFFQKGLSFLINDCNLVHNNVCISSIFVDPAGEWKLGGVDYMYPASGQDSVPPVKILPMLEKYDPPEKVDLRKGMMAKKW